MRFFTLAVNSVFVVVAIDGTICPAIVKAAVNKLFLFKTLCLRIIPQSLHNWKDYKHIHFVLFTFFTQLG